MGKLQRLKLLRRTLRSLPTTITRIPVPTTTMAPSYSLGFNPALYSHLLGRSTGITNLEAFLLGFYYPKPVKALPTNVSTKDSLCRADTRETGFSKSGKVVKVAKRLPRPLFRDYRRTAAVPSSREIPGLKCSYLKYCFLHTVPETKPIGSGLWSPGATVS